MPTQGSPPGQISSFDWKKILIGAAIATGGALCTYALDSVLPDLKERGLIDAAAFVFFSTLINAIRKFVTDSRIVVWVACWLAIGGTAIAADVAVVVDDSKPGTYLLTVGADGAVAVNPIRVIRPGQPHDPGPTPPPGDPTPFMSEVERQTKAVLSAGGSATTGAALSSVYSLVADEVAAGRIAPASALPAIKAATDLVMSKQADAAQWTGWRTAIGDSLTILQAQGQLGTKEQVSSALKQVATGVSRATGFRTDPRDLVTQEGKPVASVRKDFGILDGIDIAKIIELIKLVMELLKLFGGLN